MSTYAHHYGSLLIRLSAMLTRLYNRTPLNPADLAREFDVSERTILRDLNRLKKANCPIEKGGEGYRLKSCELENITEYMSMIKTVQKAIKKHQNVVVKKDEETFVIAPLRIENNDGLWRLVGMNISGKELCWYLKEITKIKKQKGI
ncbi:MAG: HTH domain-containing protein [Helicobacteraceae bacterium]|nr:HTH domain-containing protein [Helicobacteraceae bacterium]